MKIDYSTYTEDELLDVLDHIDKGKYPERTQVVRNQLKSVRKHFEEVVKPTLSNDDLFKLKSEDVSAEAYQNGHAVEYSIFSGAIILGAYFFTESMSATLFLCFAIVVGWFVNFKSKNKDMAIFQGHQCPLCEGDLHFEKAGYGNFKYWYMHCWACKKMAKLSYRGMSLSGDS